MKTMRVWAILILGLMLGLPEGRAQTGTASSAATKLRRGGRTAETVITSSRLEYDYKESVVLFEENVKVNDPQFTMSADRVLVFLEGTNDVRQVRALGNVVLTSDNRTARCNQAVYTKADGKIVMTGEVMLQRAKDQLWGKEAVIWVNDQRMQITGGSRMVIQPETIGEGGQLLP